MNLVDVHTHIDFYDEPQDIIKQYNNQSILTLYMTYLPEIFEMHKKEKLETKYIRMALGYHPGMVLNYKFKKDVFISNLNMTNYIGEIGLDYSITKDEEKIKEQKEIFDFITSVTNSKKILSIHSKKAEVDVFDILIKNDVKNAIFHWYSGPIGLINKIINRGYYFSVNSQMLKSQKGQKILKKIPIELLLIESDGPFTKCKNKIITPPDIKIVYSYFSEFYNNSDLEDIIYNNFIRLLKQRKSFEKD